MFIGPYILIDCKSISSFSVSFEEQKKVNYLPFRFYFHIALLLASIQKQNS